MPTSFGNSNHNIIINSLYLNENVRYSFLKHKSLTSNLKKEAGHTQLHGQYREQIDPETNEIDELECLVF